MMTFQDTGPRTWTDPTGAPEDQDAPLLAPVTPTLSWSWVHALSQRPLRMNASGQNGHRHEDPVIAPIRRTATIRRGTRMVKPLSPRQLSACLRGRPPSGFCYRSCDLRDLRTLDELAMLTGDSVRIGQDANSVVFALRWRAVDPIDYSIPLSLPVDDTPAFDGLVTISPHERLGPPVLGTGFAPSSHHLIPEFVSTDFADLPLPANSVLVAFAADGTETSLYSYQAEQHAWLRMFGAAWRHVVSTVPEIAPEQEYLPVAPEQRSLSRLVGEYRGDAYDALADPPHEFRVLARSRAARYPVETLSRRTPYAEWRGKAWTVVRAEGGWLRLRLCRPDGDTVHALGAQCVERGVYEVWAPAIEVGNRREASVGYPLAPDPTDH